MNHTWQKHPISIKIKTEVSRFSKSNPTPYSWIRGPYRFDRFFYQFQPQLNIYSTGPKSWSMRAYNIKLNFLKNNCTYMETWTLSQQIPPSATINKRQKKRISCLGPTHFIVTETKTNWLVLTAPGNNFAKRESSYNYQVLFFIIISSQST